MADDYWSTLFEFLAGFGRRAVYVLGVALLGVVDALSVFEPFLGFKLMGRIPPGLFWGAVGLGLFWAAFETYRTKERLPASLSGLGDEAGWDLDTYRAMKHREWREKVQNFEGSAIYKVSCWSEMRPHLDPEVVEAVESGFRAVPRYTVGRENPSDKEIVLDDLGRLAKDWELL